MTALSPGKIPALFSKVGQTARQRSRDVSCAVGGWDACGNRFYSKVELYQMAWADIDLSNLRSLVNPKMKAMALLS